MWENILGSHCEINQMHSLWLNLFHFDLLGYEMRDNTALCHQLTKCFIIFERTNYMYIGELYHLWFLLERLFLLSRLPATFQSTMNKKEIPHILSLHN